MGEFPVPALFATIWGSTAVMGSVEVGGVGFQDIRYSMRTARHSSSEHRADSTGVVVLHEFFEGRD